MHRLRREDEETVTGVKIGYIGGGSQGWAHTLINDLAQCETIAGEVALYDVDHEAARKNAELGNQVMDREEAVGEWTFTAHEDRALALRDADFVVCSIQDPPEETFAHDIDIPQEYGIYQTVADTVGPGGTLRSMRAIPQYYDIAATVREECPDAWVINYTNPMTTCTRALYEAYPDINAIGLCHEVFKSQDLFAGMAERYVEGAENVERDEIDVNVKGINHFTWIDEARWRGRDLTAYLDEELQRRKPIPGHEPGDLDGESYWTNDCQIAFDLYEHFGMLGAAGDRHLAEFVPWYLDIDAPEEIQRWGIRLTPSSARVGDDEGPAEMERYLSGEDTFEFSDSGEEIVDILGALLGLGPMKTHLNYPNRGQIENLPRGAVVETNALITGDDVSPLTAGELPEQLRSMVMTHVTNQETLIEAANDGDVDAAFRAFLNDPLVSVDRPAASELFTELVDVERAYLDAWDLEGARVLT